MRFFRAVAALYERCDSEAALAASAVHETFLRFGLEGPAHGAWSGAYGIMPDNLHLFVATDDEKMALANWMKFLKNMISTGLRLAGVAPPHWQKTFFDHLLRSGESYSEKWNYVRNNPVRHGFVANADDWPWQGEIEDLRL